MRRHRVASWLCGVCGAWRNKRLVVAALINSRRMMGVVKQLDVAQTITVSGIVRVGSAA